MIRLETAALRLGFDTPYMVEIEKEREMAERLTNREIQVYIDSYMEHGSPKTREILDKLRIINVPVKVRAYDAIRGERQFNFAW